MRAMLCSPVFDLDLRKSVVRLVLALALGVGRDMDGKVAPAPPTAPATLLPEYYKYYNYIIIRRINCFHR